jgi:hypothetical protein
VSATTGGRGGTGIADALAPGVALALGLAGVWVAATALTGQTYHLAPLLTAFAPGLAARIVSGARGGALAAAAAALGAMAAAAGWGALLLLDIEPAATLLPAQPGGVRGEFLAGALLGAAAGAAALRPGRRARTVP